MRKILSLFLLLTYILWCIMGIYSPSVTNSSAAPWTREKALYLAKSTLFNPDTKIVDALFAAGSASAAVQILFPDATGPDRSAYTSVLTMYTSSGFNWADQNHMARLYQMKYALDPYEAKRKLFSLFEDIYAVNANVSTISYKDITDQHDLLYSLMLGNYQVLVKRLLNNNGNPGDYAEGEFLNLFNQADPRSPNENYARELMQLFVMGEYEPLKSKENNDVRNYEETDVRALSRILTGYKTDKMTHTISFDINSHYTGSVIYLTGAVPMGSSFPFYNAASGTIDTVSILNPVNGNNGLSDNIIEYMFAKRSSQIALFLADRIYRFYVQDTPTRSELDSIATIILANNFEMLPSIRSILALDLMYTDAAMNTIHYKNPLELYVGTLKRIRGNSMSGILLDANLYDTSILRRLNWNPYFPGSVFGRDGFDDSRKWNNSGIQNGWMNTTNYFTYRTTGTGVIDFRLPLGDYRKTLTNEVIPVTTDIYNSYTGTLILQSGTFTIESGSGIQSLSVLQSVNEVNTSENRIHSEKYRDTSETQLIENFIEPYSIDLSQESPVESQEEVSIIAPVSETVSIPPSELSGAIQTGATSLDSGDMILMSASVESPTVMEEMPESIDGISVPEMTGSVLENTSKSQEGTGNSLVPAVETSSGIESVTLNVLVPQAQEITLMTGVVIFPRFEIVTSSGNISVFSGSYNAQMKTLRIYSGSLTNGNKISRITNGTFIFTPASFLIADIITPEKIYDTYERYILDDQRLPLDVRNEVLKFIQYDGSGKTLPLAPTNTRYYNSVIRGLLSFFLVQPEYTLLRGANLPTTVDTSEQRMIENSTGKIIFIELYGGNDYLSSIIPKDEYDIYKEYRTYGTGSSAITGTGLVDIGNYYMNSALAYSNSGVPTFKSLYDNGYLKLFNRVGVPSHSQDHSAAAKQISSFRGTTLTVANGVFGELINREFNSLHTISLGARNPNIYRGGKYVNMGGDLIVTNFLDSQSTIHVDLMGRVSRFRSYPGDTGDMYRSAVNISDTGKLSRSQGGPSGATGDMNSVFKFLKVLLANNIGRSYYMGGRGGYDTHNQQFIGLNENLRFVAESVTKFFNEVKDTQDVTIVIFSEFGRTSRTNGDLGTDHGDGGGMYVVSSNKKLLQSLEAPTYGNMALKYARSGLGVGIDYRSVYSKIYNALYDIDGRSFFQTTATLENDVSLEKNTMSLLSYAYRPTGPNSVSADIQFSVTGSNYSPAMAGYTFITTGTGIQDQKPINIRPILKDGYYKINFTLNSITQPYYTITSLSNQYVPVQIVGMLTGASLPIILKNTEKTISYTGSSILPFFIDNMAPRTLAGSGLILSASGNTSVNIPLQNFEIRFDSGSTRVTEVTTRSGQLAWNGGFILGERLDRNTFIPDSALLIAENRNVPKSNIVQVNKIGADRIGVGMKLNKNVQLAFTNIMNSGSYRVITSDDGMSWSDVEFPGKTYQKDANNSISFPTNHFSYFALLSDLAVVPLPSCNVSISPATITNGSSANLSWTLTNSLTGLLMPGNTLLGVSGIQSVVPPISSTTRYTIMTSNTSGTATCSAQVTTTPAPPPGAPSCTLSSSPSTVLNGSGTTLTWNIVNSLTGLLSPLNTVVATSGSTFTLPGANMTTNYNLSVSNSAGSSSCTTSVTASSGMVVPPVTPPVKPPITPPVKPPITPPVKPPITPPVLPPVLPPVTPPVTPPVIPPSSTGYSAGPGGSSASGPYPIIAKNENIQRNPVIQEVIPKKESKTILREIVRTPLPVVKRAPLEHTRYVAAENRLTLRSTPALRQDNAVTFLPRNMAVTILSDSGDWSYVNADGWKGYLKNEYLRSWTMEDDIRSGLTPVMEGQRGYISVAQSLYMRGKPNVFSRIHGVLYSGQDVTILDRVGKWYEVATPYFRGYIYEAYLKM